MDELASQLRSLLKDIWRHRWYAMATAWFLAAIGWIIVFKMPEKFEADARVYADTQSILRPLLQGLAVQPNLDQLVAMMGHTLISRTNLEKIVQMSGMGSEVKSDADRTKLLNRLSGAITVKAAGKENLYTISYVDRDPQIAQQVVQALLKIFMESSIVDNKKDSESAQAFIDEQLHSYREKLVDAESAITDFKRKHLGFMPGEGPGYFARLDEAKTALKRANLELKEAENSLESIRKRLSSESATLPVPAEAASNSAGVPESELDKRIAALEQKLDNLRLTYTEEHPDIVASVRILGQLKAQRKAETERLNAELEAKGSTPTLAQVRNPVFQQLSISLTTAEANVAAIRARVADYAQRYAELQSAGSAMPQIETEYTQLTRDYEVNKARYAELLRRRDSAQISGDMESSEAAMAFRVIDSPHVIPITPNRHILMSLVLLGAIAGGMAMAFFMGQVKPTINDEHRLKDVTGLRVLGTVAMSLTEPQKRNRRRGLVALIASFIGLLSAYAGVMAILLFTSARI